MTARPAHARRRGPLASAIALAIVAATALLITPSAPASALPTGYTVSGTVLADQAGGGTVPVGGASVYLYSLSGDGGWNQSFKWTESDDLTGTYSIANVPPGKYRIQFTNSAWPNFWQGDTAFQGSAQVITVSNADVTGLVATDARESTISGTITFPSGTAWSSQLLVEAEAWNPATHSFDMSRSNGDVQSNGTFTVRSLYPGQYILRFFDIAQPPTVGTAYWSASGSVTDPTQADPITVSSGDALTGYSITAPGAWQYYTGRVSGADRFATSVAVSKGFTTAPVVFVTNGLNYPDALGASAAAAAAGGPLLLVRPTSVPANVSAEIARLKATKVVIVGGLGAVSAAAQSQLAAIHGVTSVVRLSGTDRYATSRAIAEQSFQPHLGALFVATGANYPDALVAGSAAGYLGAPLLLLNGSSDTVDQATIDAITALDPDTIYVVGGTGAVSAGVATALQGIPSVSTVLRLRGADRYATAAAVNQAVFPFADTGFVATSQGFADALSISAVAGVTGAPLYLSQPGCFNDTSWQAGRALHINTYLLVGGTGALGANVYNQWTCSELGASAAPLHSSSGTLGAPQAGAKAPVHESPTPVQALPTLPAPRR